MAGDDLAYLLQPRQALLERAGHYYPEHPALKDLNPAQREDAVAPQSLQGVSEDLALALRRRVGGIEDHRGFRTQQTEGNALAAVPLLELVGDVNAQDPIDPALEDGRWLAPPVRMYDDDAVGTRDLFTMDCDGGRKCCIWL